MSVYGVSKNVCIETTPAREAQCCMWTTRSELGCSTLSLSIHWVNCNIRFFALLILADSPPPNFLPSPRCLHRFSGRIPNWTHSFGPKFFLHFYPILFLFLTGIKRGMFFVSHNLQKSLLFPTKKYCTWPTCCMYFLYLFFNFCSTSCIWNCITNDNKVVIIVGSKLTEKL